MNTTSTPIENVTFVPVENIVAGENDRKVFNAVALAELADSIASHGLAQPVLVRPVYTCETCGDVQSVPFACHFAPAVKVYQIVAGERRTRAMRDILGWTSIPCIVRSISDDEAAAIMLLENTGREDLNVIEEAAAYAKRQQKYGWDVEQIAKTAGVSTEQVKRRMLLLALAPDIQHLAATGNLPLSHAEAMCRLDVNRQRIALRVFQASDVSPDIIMFRRLCSKLFMEQEQESLFDMDDFALESMIAEAAKPRQGKGADLSHVPQNDALPAVLVGRKDTAAVVIERWLDELKKAGHTQEAEAVGTLYAAMVKGRLMKVPYEIAYIG